MTRAGWVVTAAVAAALAGAAAWAASSLGDAEQAAADAAADTAACRRLVGQITAMGEGAAPADAGGEDVGPRIERAMAAAEIDADALTRVAPQPPRQGRRSTQVGLRSVTLRQALSFVSALVNGRGVSLESFRLTVPAAEGTSDGEWDVELSVSQATQKSR